MSPRAGVDLPTVLRVASEIVDEQGMESLSLSSLAQKLGIRPPSLYNHVTGLPGLRANLAAYGCNLLNATITRAAVGRSGDTAVRAMADAYLAFARVHPGLYEAIQRVPDAQESAWQQAAEQIVDTVVQVFKHYKLDDEEAIHAVRGFRSLVHGFTSLERNGDFGIPIDVDVSYRFLIDTFLSGLYTMKHMSQRGEE